MLAVFQIIVLIMSAVIHEVAHGYVAYSLGDPTAKYAGRLTLNPIKHLDMFGSIILPILMYASTGGAMVFGWAKPVPYNPYNLRQGKWGPAIVAVAGPAANLIIAIIFALIVRLGGASISPTFVGLSGIIVIINVLLCIFNLIPMPPLDGSKVLFALLPRRAVAVEEFLNRYQLFVLLFVLIFGWQIIRVPVLLLSGFLLGIPI